MTEPNKDHNHYEFGVEIVLQGTFVDRDDVPTDPTTGICQVKRPGGTIDDVDIEATIIVGTWEGFYTPTVPGKHWYAITGQGVINTRGERAFQVLEPNVEEIS